MFDKTKIYLDSNSKHLTEIECIRIDEMFIHLIVELLRVYTHRAFISWPKQIIDNKTLGKLHAEFSSRITAIQSATDDTRKHIPRDGEPEIDVSGVTAYYLLDEIYSVKDLLQNFEEFYARKNESRQLLHYLLEIRAQEVKSDGLVQFYKMICNRTDHPQAYRRSTKSTLKRYKLA